MPSSNHIHNISLMVTFRKIQHPTTLPTVSSFISHSDDRPTSPTAPHERGPDSSRRVVLKQAPVPLFVQNRTTSLLHDFRGPRHVPPTISGSALPRVAYPHLSASRANSIYAADASCSRGAQHMPVLAGCVVLRRGAKLPYTSPVLPHRLAMEGLTCGTECIQLTPTRIYETSLRVENLKPNSLCYSR